MGFLGWVSGYHPKVMGNAGIIGKSQVSTHGRGPAARHHHISAESQIWEGWSSGQREMAGQEEEGRQSWESTQNSGRPVRLTFITQEASECSRRRLQLAQKAQGRAQINFILSTFWTTLNSWCSTLLSPCICLTMGATLGFVECGHRIS